MFFVFKQVSEVYQNFSTLGLSEESRLSSNFSFLKYFSQWFFYLVLRLNLTRHNEKVQFVSRQLRVQRENGLPKLQISHFTF